MDNLTTVCNQAAFRDFVFQVYVKFAVLNDVVDEVKHVSGVHLASVCGHGAWHVQRPQYGNVVLDDLLPWLGEFAVATGLSREVDDDRAGLHVNYHVGVDEPRGRSSRYRRCGDDEVHVLDCRVNEVSALALGLLGQLTRVPAGALGLLAEIDFQECRAEAFDLITDDWPYIVR